MSKTLPFSICALGLSLSKIWHDTLVLFLSAYEKDATREQIGGYINANTAGMLLGALVAGSLTDAFTPKITFPISIFMIGFTSTILILMYEMPKFTILFGRFISFAFLCLIFYILVRVVYSVIKKRRIKVGATITDSDKFILYMVAIIAMPGLYFLSTKVFAILNGFDLFKSIIMFVRGFCISVGMNAAYVAVGNLFRNDPFLPTASNYLYMSLFGALAILPMIVSYLPAKPIFVGLNILMYVSSLLLWFNVPKTKRSEFNLGTYIDSCRKLAVKPEFIAVCFVSMVCIGGFYNILYIFKDALMHGSFAGNLAFMQSIGRQCTFGILVLIYLFNISFLKTSSKNCSQYMAFGMCVVGLMCLVMFALHLNIANQNLGLFAQIAFWITCICTGFSQPAAKYSVLSIAQRLGKNITGTAQSFVTLSNSIIEQQGAWVIMFTPYPMGGRIYLGCFGVFAILLGAYLYLNRDSVNRYLVVVKKNESDIILD